MTAMLWEFSIATVYWSVLFKIHGGRIIDDPKLKFWNTDYHALMMILLLVEWLLNRIYFEIN